MDYSIAKSMEFMFQTIDKVGNILWNIIKTFLYFWKVAGKRSWRSWRKSV